MIRLLTAPLLVLLGACAFGPGTPFGTVDAQLAYGVTTPPGREAGAGFQKVDTGYEAKLTTATLEVEEVGLVALAASTGPTAFDPANPPPGYTLCHNGHCDKVTGETVPYDEVAAELAASGGVGATTVLALEGGEVDALVPGTLPLTCASACALPRTEISQVQALLSAGTFSGLVRDGQSPARFEGERAFRLGFSEDAGDSHVQLSAPLALVTDNTEPPQISLGLTLELSAAIFDGVDFAALAQDTDGAVSFDLPANAAARAKVLENLGRLGLSPTVARSR